MSSYLGESSEEPLTCSGDFTRLESPWSSDPSTLLSSSNSEVLLSPKSSKCSSSPPMTVTKVGWWLWSSEFRENLRITQEQIAVFMCLSSLVFTATTAYLNVHLSYNKRKRCQVMGQPTILKVETVK